MVEFDGLTDEAAEEILAMSGKILDIFDNQDIDTALKAIGAALMTILCDTAPSKDLATKALVQLYVGVAMSMEVNDEMGKCNWNATIQ